MNENKKTIIFAAVAAVLLVMAFVFSPRRITPEAFMDQGESFFQNFTDPNAATTLEVIDFDENTGSAKPFKVTFNNGRWTIPSHYDYPADARDRLAKTAADVITLRKDDFRTDNVSDQERCGVIDPLDETAGLKGRGQRVTFRGEGDRLLADLIIGGFVDGRPGFRFVRVPGQNRIYAVKMNMNISARFEDWIDTDLLRLVKNKVEEIELKDYSIDERTGRVNNRDDLILRLKDNRWTANRAGKGQQADSTAMENLLEALSGLKIVGVRPKPAGLSAGLKGDNSQVRISTADAASLQQKGFYFSQDGQLLSNEGELKVGTSDGVVYTLRFGEVVYGSGDAVSAGIESSEPAAKTKEAENRYLFISADFNSKYFSEPPKAKDSSYKGKPDSLLTIADRQNKEMDNKWTAWKSKVDNGRKLAGDLNNRFADWYYVISGASYDNIRLKRSDLMTGQ